MSFREFSQIDLSENRAGSVARCYKMCPNSCHEERWRDSEIALHRLCVFSLAQILCNQTATV